MRTIIALTTFCLFSVKLFSQDTETKTHRLSFSTNIIQLPLDEISLYIDYCFKERHSIGIEGGYIYANNYSQRNAGNNGKVASAMGMTLFLRDYDRNPGFVYYGYVTRLNYKFYFSVSKHKSVTRQAYLAIQGLYKSESYNNQLFSSMYKYSEVYFTRNEQAIVLGADLLFGYHIMTIQSRLNIECFVGIGVRSKERTYTTTFVEYGYNYNQQAKGIPLGTFHTTQTFPIIDIGFKIGINTFFGKT